MVILMQAGEFVWIFIALVVKTGGMYHIHPLIP